jgi:hypothetical protein
MLSSVTAPSNDPDSDAVMAKVTCVFAWTGRLVTGNPCFGSPVGIRVGNRDSRAGHTLITSQPLNVGGIREHERPQPQTWCGECGLFHRRYPVRLSLIIEAKSRVLDHTT